MRLRKFVWNLAAAAALIAPRAHAESAQPAAGKLLELSAFGGINGTYTGLAGGKNLGITAGVDLGLRPFYGFRPFLEGRGTYPVEGGQIDRQKNALGGVRVERRMRAGLRLYGDLLLGRGEIRYQNGGYPEPGGNFLLLSNTSNVYSPGVGAEFRIAEHLSGLVDVQFQHYDTAATSSGGLWAKPIMAGVRYRINFNRHGYAVAR